MAAVARGPRPLTGGSRAALGCWWLLLAARLGLGDAASVSCSESDGGAGACAQALDGNRSSAWASGSRLPAWIEVEPFAGAPLPVGTYALTAGPDASTAPSAWVLEAVDGGRRVYLDGDSFSGWRAGQTRIREVTLGGGRAYGRYRLTVSATQGGRHAELAELQLLPLVTDSFRADAWEACSATCGGGRQRRRVVCHGSDGLDYGDARCGAIAKPPAVRQCNTAPCTCWGRLLCGVPCAASSSLVPLLGCSAVADGLVTTAWTSSGLLPHSLSFNLSEPTLLRAFSVTATACRECAKVESPGSLTLLGSADGAAWVQLAHQGALGPWAASQQRTFRVVPPAGGLLPYRHYRLTVDTLQGPGNALSLAEVDLEPTDAQLVLEISAWGPCAGAAGEGSCGSGRQERSVVCRGSSGRSFPLSLCDGGVTASKVRGCTVPCPQILGANASSHPGRFGVIAASLEVSERTALACAALGTPAGGAGGRAAGQRPSEGDVLSAATVVKRLCGPAPCSVELQSLGSASEETRYELWCTVPGSGEVHPRSGGAQVVRLAPVPGLAGCFNDAVRPGEAHDLSIARGTGFSQKECSAACLGYRHFGLQARGDCYCGDFYGRYGPRVADLSEGIMGCNCRGPYFGFQASCIWSHSKQSTAIQSLVVSRSTPSALELLISVEANTSVLCSATAVPASAPAAAAAATETACLPGSCSLMLQGLRPGAQYNVSCAASGAEAAPRGRATSLLARTDAAAVTGASVAGPPEPERVAPPPPDLVAPPTPAPAPEGPHSPGAEMPFIALVCALLALGGVAGAVLKTMGLRDFEMPSSFWLFWEAAAVLQFAAGLSFLLELLHGRAGAAAAAQWDTLATVVGGSVVCGGELHALGFLGFGLLPLAGRCLAKGVGREHHYEVRGPPHHRHRPEKKSGKRQQPLPIDTEAGSNALLFLPGVGLVAVCASDDHELRQVSARKVLLRFASCLVQDVPLLGCCVAHWAGGGGVSGMSLLCTFASSVMVLLLAVALRGVVSRGGGLFSQRDLETASLGALHLEDLPPPPKPEAAVASGKRRRPEANEGRVHQPGDTGLHTLRGPGALAGKADSRHSALRSAAMVAKPGPELRTSAAPWGIAPRRGEAPKPLPSRIGGR